MKNSKKSIKELKKILFLDIDGVLTSTPKYIPNTSPILTLKSIKAISEAQESDSPLFLLLQDQLEN